MTDFSIDVSDVEAAAAALELVDDRLDPIAEETIGDMAEGVREAVRREGRRHVDTGEMLERIAITDRREAGMSSTATVKAGGIVAPRIIQGQAPHTIRARHARALTFGGSPATFAASVRHPGTAPDPFVARGIRSSDIDGMTDRAAAVAADRIAEAVDGGI